MTFNIYCWDWFLSSGSAWQVLFFKVVNMVVIWGPPAAVVPEVSRGGNQHRQSVCVGQSAVLDDVTNSPNISGAKSLKPYVILIQSP